MANVLQHGCDSTGMGLVSTRDKDTGWSGDVLPPSQNGHARQRPLQEQVDEYEYISPDGYGYPIYDSRAK